MTDALTEADVGSVNWADLLAQARAPTCELVNAVIKRAIEETTRPAEQIRALRAMEPVLALRPVIDPDAEAPFVPYALYWGLSRVHMQCLVAAFADSDAPEVRARILDVAWNRGRACGHELAVMAVDEYVRAAANDATDTWIPRFTLFKRAVELGASLGRGEAFHRAVSAVEHAILTSGRGDEGLGTHRLMRLLLSHKQGDAGKMSALANQLAARARNRYEKDGVGNGLQCERERAYLEVQAEWCQLAKDSDGAKACRREIAEALVRQAEGVLVAKWPSAHAVAEHFVGEAICVYRGVGGSVERVAELRYRQQELQRQSAGSWFSVKTNVDVAEVVKGAQALVAGQTPYRALCSLVFEAHEIPGQQSLQEELERQLEDAPFRKFVPASYVGPRGSRLASHRGLLRSEPPTPEEESELAAATAIELMRVAHARQGTVGALVFAPAIEQIAGEHGLDAAFFLALVERSCFVPRGRLSSFARGLAAGIRCDFDLAATLLFPQFEHAMRELFYAHGVVTTTLPAAADRTGKFDLNRDFSEQLACAGRCAWRGALV